VENEEQQLPRSVGRPRKAPDQGPKHFSDQISTDDGLSSESAIEQWLMEKGITENDTKVYLYEYVGGKREWLQDYTGHIPTISEVSEEFGSGSYSMMIGRIVSGKQDVIRRDFKISARNGRAGASKIASAPDGMAAIDSGLNILERLFDRIVKPLMEKTAAPPAAPDAMAGVYSKMAENFNKVMLDNMRSTMETQRAMMAMIPAAPVVEDDEEEDDEPIQQGTPMQQNDLIGRIIPILENVLPSLLGNKIQAAAVAPLVKAAPDFKALLEDPESLGSVGMYVAQKFGIQALEEMVGSLGIPSEVVSAVKSVLGSAE